MLTMFDFSQLLEPGAATAAVTTAWLFMKPVFDDITKQIFEDFVKNATSEKFKGLLARKETQKDWEKAIARSLKAFLEEFKIALDNAGVNEEGSRIYHNSLKTFIKDRSVATLIGSAITENQSVRFTILAKKWLSLNLEQLPDNFEWTELSQRYKESANKILENDKTLREIISMKSAQTTAEGVQKISGIDPGFNLTTYALALRNRYGLLKVESLYPAADNRSIALTKVFVEQTVRSCQQFNPRIHELPLERRRSLKEKGALQEELDDDRVIRQRELFFQQPPLPVLEVLRNPKQRLVVILGDPGSGKSVLLNQLALQWAELPPVGRATHPIPLLIEFKAYVRDCQQGACRDFLEYIEQGPSCVTQLNKKNLDDSLQEGEAFFLLDGLDEVFDNALRQNIAHELVRFSIRYPLSRFVVTSRIIGYDLVAQILRDAGFHHFMLQELDSEQQLSFLQKWHELAYPDPHERKSKHDRLQTAIRDTAAIRELADNPLLLTLMALLNRYKELPRDRNTLYEEASKLMLHQWDTARALQSDPLLAQETIDDIDKQSMLKAVAFTMQSSPKGLAGNAIASKELENILSNYLESQGYESYRRLAKRLVQQLRERNYILCLLGDDYYAFVHRTFLEFFCASAWVSKYKEGEKGDRYTLEEIRAATFDKYWQDEKWHEVLRLIAAQLQPESAEKLLLPILDKKDSTNQHRNIFLVASCFAVLRNKKPLQILAVKLEKQLDALLHFDLPYYYNFLYFEEISQVKNIRQSVIRSRVSCWPGIDTTKQWLKHRAQNDEHWTVRQAAVQELKGFELF